jgi:hypothetical protein
MSITVRASDLTNKVSFWKIRGAVIGPIERLADIANQLSKSRFGLMRPDELMSSLNKKELEGLR